MTISLAPLSAPVRVESPHPPGEPASPRFPLVATIAPVVASLGLFAFTRSPFALAFAFLGPVVAVGSLVDARLQRRKSTRRDRARFDAEWDHARACIVAAHTAERNSLEQRFPPLARVEPHWSPDDESTQLRVGVGRATSSVSLTTVPAFGVAAAYRDRLEHLAHLAGQVDEAPLCIDAARGVTLRGDRGAALAVARAIVLRWAALLSPQRFRIERGANEDWLWVDELPHAVIVRGGEHDGAFFVRQDRGGSVDARAETGEFVVSLASFEQPVRGSVVTVRAAGQAALVVDSGSREFTPDLAAVAQARSMARELRLAWAGIAGQSGIPASVSFAELLQPGASGESDVRREIAPTLRAAIGRSRDGDVVVDLVTAGPHAIVGGTTGSGKSELLLSWVLAMSAVRSPAELTFLFVDYKGGASFGPLARLPHCVGVLTDLDDEYSARALASLAAELRFRERRLAQGGLRSIDERTEHSGPPFPRLVVVVDEFAALVDGNADLHRLFLDLASRGRSLGVHLILCTQRPSGVVRDGILANAGLRLSLRVTSASDSTAVIGTDHASKLPVAPKGRALVAEVGSAAVEFQVAQSTPADAEQIIDAWRGAEAPRRPWLSPLAARIVLPTAESLRSLAGSAIEAGRVVPFGMIDLPHDQRQHVVSWQPREQGGLVVVGAARSGKTSTLATLARASLSTSPMLVDSGLPAVWDALDWACRRLDARPEPSDTPAVAQHDTLILLDDLDAVLGSAPDEYVAALVDRLTRVIREGAANGVTVAFSAQRLTGPLSSAVALCGARLVLRLADRQEHLFAGGDGEHYSAALPPGAGWWGAHRVQVFDSSERGSLDGDDRDLDSGDVSLRTLWERVGSTQSGLSIVSAHPDATLALLEESEASGASVDLIHVGDARAAQQIATATAERRRYAVIGDPDAWQADWALLSGLRREVVLFDGCSLAEVRAITRSRTLPPPFAAREQSRWLRTPDGEFRRVRL